MPENNPNRHHYLPVFYLDRWTGNDGKLVHFYRPYRDVFASPLTPSYTAFEEGLYRLDGMPPEKRQVIETHFMSAVIDGPAAPVVEKIIAHGPATLTNDERVSFARFIRSLELRNPQAIEEVRAVSNQSIREELDRLQDPEYLAIRKDGDPDTLWEWAWKNLPLYMAEAHLRALPDLIDHAGIGLHLIRMCWGILNTSEVSHSLLTCDRPMIRTAGLKDPKAFVAVPLSPSRLFVAANSPAQLQKIKMQPIGDTVRKMNNLIARLAVTNIYGDNRRHLKFVEARLRKPTDLIVPAFRRSQSAGRPPNAASSSE